MEYNLIRSRRKTISIQVTADARVVVRAPIQTPETVIDGLVRQKSSWINKHLETHNQQLHQRRAFALHYNDTALLCGAPYPIRASSAKRAVFDGQAFRLPENLSPEEIKAEMICLYKSLAKSILTEKAAQFAQIMSLYPSAVKINSAKTRWGSCSGKNSINFSWRLVLARHDIIDYVVVHELAHIREHNHSDKFWRIVENVFPDYRQRRQGLKALQKILVQEDWD